MFSPDNRFQLLDKLIRATEDLDTTRLTHELQRLDHDSLFQLWDAKKIALVDQGIMTKDDPFIKANSRNARTNKSLKISISREAVYIDEICRHLGKLHGIEHDKFFTQFGEELQYSKNKCGNFQTNFSLDLGPKDEASTSSTVSSDLEDRIVTRVVFRLTEILDQRLKAYQTLPERVEAAEVDLINLTNSFKLYRTNLEDRLKLKLPKMDSSKVQEKQKKIDDRLQSLEDLKSTLEKDLSEAVQPAGPTRVLPSPSTALPTPDRFQVWGRGTDMSGAPAIPRVYNFAVSKIPNKPEFSTDWLLNEQKRIFQMYDLQATIISVEQIKASFQGARTKSFKVLIMTEDRAVHLEKFLNPNIWISGVSVTKFRRPRHPRLEIPTTGSGTQNLYESQPV